MWTTHCDNVKIKCEINRLFSDTLVALVHFYVWIYFLYFTGLYVCWQITECVSQFAVRTSVFIISCCLTKLLITESMNQDVCIGNEVRYLIKKRNSVLALVKLRGDQGGGKDSRQRWRSRICQMERTNWSRQVETQVCRRSSSLSVCFLVVKEALVVTTQPVMSLWLVC